MERRTLLKGVSGVGATVAVGGFGLSAFTGGAADTSLEATDPEAVTTDDGQIKYVAFGGRLRFEWDGLDNVATYGWYKTETRVNTGGSWTDWRTHGSAGYGELGDGSGGDGDGEFEEGETDGWGGNNDSNSGSGTDGFFQFKYGDYAIAGSGSGLSDFQNKYDPSVFEADTDGGKQETQIQFRKTCRVYAGEPGNGGTELIERSDKAAFTVTVNNRAATASIGGEVDGEVGADES